MSKFRQPGKWKTDGPARANTGFSIKKESISAPIPRIEDDEFPIRTPGASIATPLGRDSLDGRSIRFVTSLVPDPRRSGNDVSIPTDPPRANKSPSTKSNRTNSTPLPPSEQPTPLRRSPSVGSHRSIQKPERKKSTLRSVFGRIFGKKRKSTSPQRKTDSQDLRDSQHRSDPTAFQNKPPLKTNAQKRSASLPINEFNRALRSHSVVIEDFPLRESFEPRDSPKAEGSFTRPRGATTPSRLWDQNKAPGPGYMDWTGLSPRPASSHARGSKVDSAPEPREVGVALTSGSKQENRKSRSVGDLRDAMLNTVTRRRSDEIRYWRQSYENGVLSPMSSNKPDVEEEPLVVEEQVESDKENYEPPQPFNFGPMGEMAGMKITQAASLETRVMRLEDRMTRLERAVSGTYHDSPERKTKSIGRPTTGDSEFSLPKNKIHRSSPQRPIRQGPGSQFRSSSYGSSRPSTQNTTATAIDSYPPPPAFSTFHPNAPTRPLSNSNTIRSTAPAPNGLAPSPSLRELPLNTDHYTLLQTMIHHEQTARLHLEDIVQNLQQEVLTLRQSIAHHPAFSTFSHDSDDDDNDDSRFNAEDFQTPMEELPPANGREREFGDEIFGHVSGNRGVGYERGGHGKSESRTLSLGQITQKGQLAGTNF